MKHAVVVLLLLVWWIQVSVAVDCAQLGGAPDCVQIVNQGDCFLRIQNGTGVSIPQPQRNTFTCYRTRIDEIALLPGIPPLPTCVVDFTRNNPGFENRPLTRGGSAPCGSNTETTTFILAPLQRPDGQYRNRQFCRFNSMCDDPDALLEVFMFPDDVIIEPRRQCDPTEVAKCVDILRMGFPDDNVCTTCGIESDTKTCEEDYDIPLPFRQTYCGCREFNSIFQSNARGRCNPGFRILAVCTRIPCTLQQVPPIKLSPSAGGDPGPAGFGPQRAVSCSTPDPVGPKRRMGKRSIPTDAAWEHFAFRMKRGVGFARPIVVPCDAGCEFRDNVLTVASEGVWLQKFRNIQVFQVYNEMIGFQTFYGSAPRLFPGFGTLWVGNGIVQYIQMLPSQLTPTPEEGEIIMGLRRRTALALFDLIPSNLTEFGSADEPDPSPVVTPPPFTDRELAELDEMAREFGDACNIFLRSAACTYQEMFFDRVLPNCLVTRFDPPPRPKGARYP